MRTHWPHILIGILLSLPLSAQSGEERIWLHTDAPAYKAGDRIHFKAYVLNMDEKASTAENRYLYVEMGQDDRMLGKRVKVMERDGLYEGTMDIPEEVQLASRQDSALLFFVAVFLICASREKDEDEMISSIRRQTLSIFIYILFFLYFLAGLFFSLDIGLHFVKDYQGEVLGNTIIRITLFAIIYELVFKIRLWLNRRESK